LITLTVIALAFFTVGIFFSLANNLRARAVELGRDTTVIFYLRTDIPSVEREAVIREIRTAPLVSGAAFVEAEDARSRFLGAFPGLQDVVESLGRNPFPVSIEAVLKDPASPSDTVQAFIAGIRRNAGVEDAVFNRDTAERVRSLGRLAQALGFGLGGLLIAASIVVISGVVKLNVLARKEEIEILRLVGATNAYLRGPYLLEGFLLGIIGSAVAVFLTALAGRFFPSGLAAALGPLGEIIAFHPLTALQILGLLAAGGLSGIAGSATALARFTRI